MDKSTRSAHRFTGYLILAAVLCALGVAVIYIMAAGNPQAGDANLPPNNNGQPPPLVDRSGQAKPAVVLSSLTVRVTGSAEWLAHCRVFADCGDGALVSGASIGQGRFLFENGLAQGATVFAIARSKDQVDAQTGRAIPAAQASAPLTITEPPRSHWEVELRLMETDCLTVRVEDTQHRHVENASVSVDFVNSAEAMHWLSMLRAAGIDSVSDWLVGSPGRQPQIPLLLRDSSLRISAQSGDQAGASPKLTVARSEVVTVVLATALASVRILVKNPAGETVPSLGLAYRVARASNDQTAWTGVAQTNQQGNAEISTVERNVSLCLWVVSDRWYLPGGQVRVAFDAQVHEVIVCPAITVKLDITYADGQRYSGPLSVSADQTADFSRSFSSPDRWGVAGEGPVRPGDTKTPEHHQMYEVVGVPADRDLHVTAGASRPGYGRLDSVVQSVQLRDGATISLVIPVATRKQPSAKIVFKGDFTALYDASVLVKPLAQAYVADQVQLKARQETTLLQPGEYRLILAGSKSGWESEVITLEAGESRTINLPIQPPASARVTVLNERGEPISGAVLCRHDHRYADFPASAIPNWVAVSDSEGVAQLGGCGEGQVKLRVEAEGFESESISATLISGGNTDLGMVRLQRALGEIHVKIKNFDKLAGREAFLELLTSGGGKTRGPFKVASEEVVLQGIPAGRVYALCISPRNGGSWASVSGVRITIGSPKVAVEFDAATFKFDE